MDVGVKTELERVLHRQLQDIVTKYAVYVDCLRVAVVEKKVTVNDLVSYLLSLPATSLSRNGQNLTLLFNRETELKKRNTITEIFNILTTKCASFLNYGIFQFILKHYEINDASEELQYPKHLKAYINRHKVSEFAKINPLLKPKNGSKELIVKFDIETTCRLAKITDLRTCIANIMEISSLALEIIDIQEGCVVVCFFIPAHIADALFTPNTEFTTQQEEEFRAASVLWLKCNGCTFHFQREPHDGTNNSNTLHVIVSVIYFLYRSPEIKRATDLLHLSWHLIHSVYPHIANNICSTQ